MTTCVRRWPGVLPTLAEASTCCALPAVWAASGNGEAPRARALTGPSESAWQLLEEALAVSRAGRSQREIAWNLAMLGRRSALNGRPRSSGGVAAGGAA